MDIKKDSIKDLEVELEDYRKQKKKVENIVNLIGGKKGFKRTIFIDRMLITLLIVTIILDILHYFIGTTIVPPSLTLEIGVLLISIKVLWISHKRTQSEHFMFWFLSSLETRINMTLEEVRELKDRKE